MMGLISTSGKRFKLSLFFALLSLVLAICGTGLGTRGVAWAAGCNPAPTQAELSTAIQLANAGGCPGNLITLQSGATYSLTADAGSGAFAQTALPPITGNVIINGNGAIIERNSAGSTPNFRFFYLQSTGNLTLNNLTMQNGAVVNAQGGGIYNNGGSLTLTGVTLANNTSTETDNFPYSGVGGAIVMYNGTLNMSRSIVKNNSSISNNNYDASGGGLAILGGTVTIENSTLDSNQVKSFVTSSVATPYGSAISNSGNLTITNSTLTNNTNGGVFGGGGTIFSQGTLTISGSYFGSNTGPIGSAILDSGSTTTNITNSTFYNNTASEGGAIFKLITIGAINVTNSTFVNNSSGFGSGGIDIEGGSGPVRVANTLMTGNTPSEIAGTITSLGNNLLSNPAGATGLVATDLTGAAATPLNLAATPANNGGPTQTIALLAGSVAINAGNLANCPETDQRGALHLQNGVAGNKTCDIGAYAYHAPGTNLSWPQATPVTLNPIAGGRVALYQQYLTGPDSSVWFKITPGVGSKIQLYLTGAGPNAPSMPDNYDLSLYTDLNLVYNRLITPPTVRVAPDIDTPDIDTPDIDTPDIDTPDIDTPDIDTPDIDTPDLIKANLLISPQTKLPANYVNELLRSEPNPPVTFAGTYSNTAAYSAVLRHGVYAISARDGLSPERLNRNTWGNTGDFYIRVSSRPGASSDLIPFQLSVFVLDGACGSLTSVPTNLNNNYNFPAPPTKPFSTLIVTDLAHFASAGASPTEVSALRAKLDQLKDTVGGVIMDLGDTAQFARVQKANDLADNIKSCPYAKNTVASEIKAAINAYDKHYSTAANPLKYVVLIGSDNIVPFYRYPDLAAIGRESEYYPPVVDSGTAQAALRNALILSQDVYGNTVNELAFDNPVYSLPLPSIAVGRLVQTPDEIMGMINNFLNTGGVVSPKTALATGYDFLSESASTVATEFSKAIGPNTCNPVNTSPDCAKVDTLIQPPKNLPTDPTAWTADDLRAKFINAQHDLVYLAGHFSQGGTLTANYSVSQTIPISLSRVTAAEFQASPTVQANSIVFSAGCHSGYDVPGPDVIPDTTEQPGWARAFANKGVTAIIGTGYQYGDTQVTAYSALLYQEFSQELHTATADGPDGKATVPIGQALVRTKNRYLASLPGLSGIHKKVLLEATLYGLPMLGVRMTATAPFVPGGNIPTVTPPVNGLGLTYADYTIVPTLTPHTVTLNDKTTNPPTQITTQYFSGTYEGNTAQPLTIATPNLPILPLDMRNVSPANNQLILRGVGFRSGQFSDTPGVYPLSARTVTELGKSHVGFNSSVFYPAQPWTFNLFDAVNNDAGTMRLLATPVQYRSNVPGSLQAVLRKFDKMDYRLFYSSYSGPASLAAPPDIRSVVTSLDQNQNVSFSIRVTDDVADNFGNPPAGVQQVWITYTNDNGSVSPALNSWQSVDLSRSSSDPSLWQGSLSLTGVNIPAGNLKFMVQAVNGVGDVTLSSNSGAYYSLQAPSKTGTVKTRLTFQSGFPGNSGYVLDAPVIAVKLEDVSGSLPQALANLTVSIEFNGTVVQAVTGPDGVARINNSLTWPRLALLATPTDQAYNLNASFKGNSTYLPSVSVASITVKQRPTSLVLDVGQSAAPGGVPGVVATLKDRVSGKPLSGKTVFLIGYLPPGTTINGKNQFGVGVLTDYQGRAALGIPSWPAQTYRIEAYFSGKVPLFGNFTDVYYEPSAVAGTASQVVTLPPVTPLINWQNPADIIEGTPLGSEQLNAVAKFNNNVIPGTYKYEPGNGTILPGGLNQTLTVTFVPADQTNYTSATASVKINVVGVQPTVTATPDNTPNNNGWYRKDVKVTLVATPSSGGAPIKSISYTLNGKSSVVDGSSTAVTISAEGINTLSYFGTDTSGRSGTPKTLTIKLDKTAPEFDLYFDLTTRTLKLLTVDSLSGADTPPISLPVDAVENPEPYILTDKAGNSLTVGLRRVISNKHDSFAGLELSRLIYNSVNISAEVNFDSPWQENSFKVDWSPEDDKPIFSIQQEFNLPKVYRVNANYQSKPNTTRIRIQEKNHSKVDKTEKGLTLLHLISDKGKLGYSLKPSPETEPK